MTDTASPLQPRIVVLVLGYDDAQHLPECLAALQKQTYKNFSVQFIDNASRDGSLELVCKRFPEVQVEHNATNLGYAGAYAHVLRELFKSGNAQVPPDAAVLLNPDVVVDASWLEHLVKAGFADPTIALAQPKVLLWRNGPTTVLNSAGNAINYLGFGFCSDYKVEDGPQFMQNRDVSYPSGSSLLVKRGPYVDIGGLEPTFESYVEDQDLAWRARLMGYRVIVAASARCWHKYKFGRTSRNHRKFFLIERNRLWFLLRTYQARTLLVIAPAFAVMELGTLADAVVHGYFVDKLRAYVAAVRGLPGVLRARRVIQARRTKSDRELFTWLSPTVRYPEIDSAALRFANRLLSGYHAAAKRLV